MIEAIIRTERQRQVLRGRAASIRRGDQVALLAPDDADGEGIAGAVTGVRAGLDHTVALVVANRVHFVPADTTWSSSEMAHTSAIATGRSTMASPLVGRRADARAAGPGAGAGGSGAW